MSTTLVSLALIHISAALWSTGDGV